MKTLIILLTIFTLELFTQGTPEHILRVYPNWITNFDKRTVELTELIPGGPPKDGIPAIINPKFESIESARDWIADREPVIALDINGQSKAYPLQILIFHEIVNDEIADVNVLVSFCPLCYSAIIFDRNINGEVYRFGVSGLLRYSDMIMYDQKTESFWEQFTGDAIVGEMTGTSLTKIPSQIISFQQYKTIYPDGLVLSKNTGFNRPYGKNPYVGYDDVGKTPFAFLGEFDERLRPNEKVIAVKINNNYKAYPYEITWSKRVINDSFEGEDIVVFHVNGAASSLDHRKLSSSKEMGSTGVFSRKLDDYKLSFRIEDRKRIFDNQTNSEWDISGRAISGELQGKILRRLFHGDYFSFALLAFRPDTEIYIE